MLCFMFHEMLFISQFYLFQVPLPFIKPCAKIQIPILAIHRLILFIPTSSFLTHMKPAVMDTLYKVSKTLLFVIHCPKFHASTNLSTSKSISHSGCLLLSCIPIYHLCLKCHIYLKHVICTRFHIFPKKKYIFKPH
jgi:hypothetical protein